MASNKFFKLTLKVNTGKDITLYLGASNFVVTPADRGVKIYSGGESWLLHESEKYEDVLARIDQAMVASNLLPPPPTPGYKDM